jgi:hypothetical protein
MDEVIFAATAILAFVVLAGLWLVPPSLRIAADPEWSRFRARR